MASPKVEDVFQEECVQVDQLKQNQVSRVHQVFKQNKMQHIQYILPALQGFVLLNDTYSTTNQTNGYFMYFSQIRTKVCNNAIAIILMRNNFFIVFFRLSTVIFSHKTIKSVQFSIQVLTDRMIKTDSMIQ